MDAVDVPATGMHDARVTKVVTSMPKTAIHDTRFKTNIEARDPTRRVSRIGDSAKCDRASAGS